MTDEVKLHVGYVGRTRDGKRVEILGTGGPDGYPFKGDNEKTYNEFGMWSHKYPRSENDIIGPWYEPATDYPIGQWIGWNGGECPVHPQDEVQVRLLSEAHGHTLISAVAGDFDWRTKLYHNSIESFRIVAPYVEPKPPLECWMNVFPNEVYSIHNSKRAADQHCGSNRIRCVRMVEADQ